MNIRRIDDYRWQVEPIGRMRVLGIIYTSARMLDQVRHEEVLNQVANVVTMSGILKAVLAMPDIH
jgi:tRNA-splicing ligase RtcB